jgi:RsiW-degrading membrane proteinase PrsW (M82 family)
MFCSHCGQPLTEGAQFCAACGREAAASGPSRFVSSLLSVSWKEVVLLDQITGAEILKSPVFRFLCLFALTPLAIQVLGTYGSILNGLAIWSGVLWALLLFRLFGGRELRFSWAVGVLLFTFLVMLPLFQVYIAVPPHLTEWLIKSRFFLVRCFGYVFGVGVREELCKAVPLVALAVLWAGMKNPVNGLVLGMMSGVGFAASENVYYVLVTLNNAIAETRRSGDFSSFVVPVFNNVVRMMTGPFGHGCYTGIFGYFISLAAADRARRVPLFLVGLAVASVVHGSYDAFVELSVLLGVAVKAFAFFLLMTYFLKARGLGSAREVAGGMFSRTIIGARVPSNLPVPAPGTAVAERPAGVVEATLIPGHAPDTEATLVGQGLPGAALEETIRPQPAAPPAPRRPTPADTERSPVPEPLAPTPQEPVPVVSRPGADETPPAGMATIQLAAPTGRLLLRGIAGPGDGMSVPLEGEFRIGRDAAQCLVHLDEPVVSRVHALVTRNAAGLGIRRVSQTVPLYVNGQSVEEALLGPGDQIQVGSSVFVVEGA